MTAVKNDPASLAERVRSSEARSIARGARRIPGGLLPPEAAAALKKLQAGGYAASLSKCIARALSEAAARCRN